VAHISAKSQSQTDLPCSVGLRVDRVPLCGFIKDENTGTCNLDERTFSFSCGQYFGEIEIGFPSHRGMQPIAMESNLHELSARDTGRIVWVLW